MSDCSVGEISVSCAGGCGLMCTSTHCYGWCEPVVIDAGEVLAKQPAAVDPTVVEVRREGAEKHMPKPGGSDSVTLCAHGLSREGLVAGLAAVLDTGLEPVGPEGGEDKEMPFSGTVDEVLDYLDLRRSDGGASS